MGKNKASIDGLTSMAFSVRQSTPAHRAGVIFSEMARLAYTVNRLTIMRQDDSDAEESDLMALDMAIQALTSQMGFLSDLGADCTGGSGWHGTHKAENWLLPPSYSQGSDSHSQARHDPQ